MERFMDDGRRHETGTLIIDRESERKTDPITGLSDFVAKKLLKQGIKLPTAKEKVKAYLHAKYPRRRNDDWYAKRFISPNELREK